MPATYSINVGTSTEAFRKQDINSVMLDLPDNTQKLISPKDVRDAFLTTWANSAFKQTIGQANIEYLGIDSGNPSNRDIKQKIFIGKRNFAGTDIMTSNLLNNTNSDIYIYNTKPDSYLTQSTSVVILAGTNSTLHDYAPYIKSDVVNSGSALSLEFINPSLYSGPINVYSTTGRVAINGILFPTVAETSASASNGKILKYFGSYPNGVLRWAEPTLSLASIGTIGSPLNIFGTVSVNNYVGNSLEFVDNNIVPQKIGDINIGSSFSSGSYNGQNWPLSEVIRKILYPYVEPSLTLGISYNNQTILSTGLTQASIFTYSVTRYSNIIYNYSFYTGGSPAPGITHSGLSFSGSVGTSISQTFSYNLYSNSAATQSYNLIARDNPSLITFSYSTTASVVFAHPLFYGFDSTKIDLYSGSAALRATQSAAIMNTAGRYAYPYTGASQSISFNLAGSGYVYFMIPIGLASSTSAFPLISKIKDANGFVLHDSSYLNLSAFTYSSIVPVGANNVPTGTNYRVYRTIATCSYTGNSNFELIF